MTQLFVRLGYFQFWKCCFWLLWYKFASVIYYHTGYFISNVQENKPFRYTRNHVQALVVCLIYWIVLYLITANNITNYILINIEHYFTSSYLKRRWANSTIEILLSRVGNFANVFEMTGWIQHYYPVLKCLQFQH